MSNIEHLSGSTGASSVAEIEIETDANANEQPTSNISFVSGTRSSPNFPELHSALDAMMTDRTMDSVESIRARKCLLDFISYMLGMKLMLQSGS